MPELPEVQTIVNGLNKKIKGKKFLDISYCDAKKLVKEPSFEKFKKELKGKTVEKVERRAKNILIYLSDERILAIHLKMTGHLIVQNEKRKVQNGKWVGDNLPKELADPRNQFIRIVFQLSDDLIMAYSDLRKFGELRLVKHDYLRLLESKLGPEPLEPKFDLNAFKTILDASKGKIKMMLLDQSKISGIGNIYADEILFDASVRPDREIKSLSKKDIENIFKSIKKILNEGIKNRGTSDSDFRDAEGKPGGYQDFLHVYRRTGKGCLCCKSDIKRIKLGGRGTHFCPKCQK